MEKYLVSILILCTVFSSSVAQIQFDEIPINFPMVKRMMIQAAAHAGVELTTQISAYKARNYPVYVVNFEGRYSTGWTLTCTATLHEPRVGIWYVIRGNCRL